MSSARKQWAWVVAALLLLGGVAWRGSWSAAHGDAAPRGAIAKIVIEARARLSRLRLNPFRAGEDRVEPPRTDDHGYLAAADLPHRGLLPQPTVEVPPLPAHIPNPGVEAPTRVSTIDGDRGPRNLDNPELP